MVSKEDLKSMGQRMLPCAFGRDGENRQGKSWPRRSAPVQVLYGADCFDGEPVGKSRISTGAPAVM